MSISDWIIFVIMLGVMLIALGSLGTIFSSPEEVEEECTEYYTSSTKICNTLLAYGSNHLPSPPDYQYYYKTVGVKVQELEPEICYIEPEDDYVRERFWDEQWFSTTADAITEWERQLQLETGTEEGWHWNFKFYALEDHVGKNIYDREFRECNVFIFFENYHERSILGQTAYFYNDSFFGYTQITIWAQSYTPAKLSITLGETPDKSVTVWGERELEEIPAHNIPKVMQHEFGHVFGLEHQYRTLDATNSTSIMQAYLNPLELNEDRRITQNDIDAVILLYGEDGFAGWNNPIKDRFILIGDNK